MNIQVIEAFRSKKLQPVKRLDCTSQCNYGLIHSKRIILRVAREKCEHTKANSPEHQPRNRNPQITELYVSTSEEKITANHGYDI